MANQQQESSRPWILEALPLLVVILIAAHVLALVFEKLFSSSLLCIFLELVRLSCFVEFVCRCTGFTG